MGHRFRDPSPSADMPSRVPKRTCVLAAARGIWPASEPTIPPPLPVSIPLTAAAARRGASHQRFRHLRQPALEILTYNANADHSNPAQRLKAPGLVLAVDRHPARIALSPIH